jgi:tetratricopeptide (TPR) repeat protein
VAYGGPARADAQSDLEKAHNAYVAHKYEDAEARLRALLDPRSGVLKDADNIADARMYLGAALVAQNKKAEAEAVFERLLRDKPDYQPDMLRVSLQATDALIDVRSRMREELAASMAEKVRQAQEEKARIEGERLRAAQHLAMLEKLAGEETVTQVDSRWVALVPFGVGQFQNGQTALGWAFLTSEALLAIGSGVSQVLTYYNESQMNAAIRTGSSTADGYHARAQDAYIASTLFTAGFALVAIAGIIHAEVTFVPTHVEVRRRPLPELSIAPTLVPLAGRQSGDGAMLGLKGTF